eukprot:scaffold14381_cov274-Ochromonas_danica.AAC.1
MNQYHQACLRRYGQEAVRLAKAFYRNQHKKESVAAGGGGGGRGGSSNSRVRAYEMIYGDGGVVVKEWEDFLLRAVRQFT